MVGWLRFCLLSVLLALPCSRAQIQIEQFTPRSGPPGTEVQLSGNGFDPGASYTVTVGGIPMPVVSVSSDALVFRIVDGAQSGSVMISDGVTSEDVGLPFLVKRSIPGVLALPAGYDPQAYQIGTADGTSTVAADGTFQVVVEQDRPTTVWAFNGSNDPFFLALVAPSEQSVQIDIESTALSILALLPSFATREADALVTARNLLAQHPQFPALTALITQIVAQHGDFLTDARVDALLVQIANETSPQLADDPGLGALATKLPTGSYFKQINHDLLLAVPTLSGQLLPGDTNDPNYVQFTYGIAPDRSTGTDWRFEIYPVDESQFTMGLPDIQAVTGEDLVTLSSTVPINSGFVRAELGAKAIDLLGRLADWAQNELTASASAQLDPGRVEIPIRPAGIYVAHAYSGNLMTHLGIAEQLNINQQWEFMLAANVVVAAIDLGGIFVELKIDDAGYMDALLKDIAKTMIIHQAGDEGVTRTEMLDILKTVASALIKKSLQNFASPDQQGFGNGILRTLAKTIDIFEKLSSAGQAFERAAGLLAPTTFSIERSIFVVGDPFKPAITRISPLRARPGEIISIFGHKFSFDSNEVAVSFCQFPQTSPDPDEAQASATLPAELVGSPRFNILQVRVPTNWNSALSGDTAYLCVERTTTGSKADSRGLAEGLFTLISPPEILAIEPTPPLPGGVFVIRGRNFGPGASVRVNDFYSVAVLRSTETELLCSLPPNFQLGPGDHTISVSLGNETTQPFPFTIGAIPFTPGPIEPGLTIFVTKLDLSNAPDGEVSLLEAFLLARGALGRPIEIHDPCEDIPLGEPGYCGGLRDRETDFILADEIRAGGLNAADSISLVSSLAGDAIALSQALPPIGPGDEFDLDDIVLDGAAAENAPAGLIMDAAVGVKISNVTLRNWPGDGLHLINGSSGGEYRDITIESVGGIAVQISTNSNDNEFISPVIRQPGGTGWQVEGSQNLFTGVEVDRPGLHGLHLLSGATRNSFVNWNINSPATTGVFLQDAALNNRFVQMVVTNAGLHGLHLSGPDVRYNHFFSAVTGGLTDLEAAFFLEDIYQQCGGYGILVEQGASYNVIGPRRVFNNTLGGICLRGPGSIGNFIGKAYTRELSGNPILSLVYDNHGPGILLDTGARQNTLATFNIAGNEGDGILLQGPDCSSNRLEMIWTGFKYFLAGQVGAPAPAPNAGASVRMANGAVGNIIAAHETIDYTGRNCFVKDAHGIIIEGAGTSNNIVQSAEIGRTEPSASFFSGGVDFEPVGQHGILLRAGATHNTIGSEYLDYDLHIDACPGAGIRIEGQGTDHNLVLGCFLGYPNRFPSAFEDDDRNAIGIHLLNGPKGNRIGQPGPMLGFDPFGLGGGLVHSLNTIESARDACIVLENCGGTVDENGMRLFPNLIQNNAIGSAPVGIRITGDATVNDIGGPLGGPEGFVLITQRYTIHNNSIYGCSTAGIHILDNIIPSYPERNRIMQNDISFFSSIDLPPVDPHAGPPPSAGVLIQGDSSGNVIGEDFATGNFFTANLCGIFVDGGGSNIIQGNQITTFFGATLAGIVLRDSSANQIGGATPDAGNHITWNGHASHPDSSAILITGGNLNRVQGNTLTNTTGAGLLIVNSSSNQIGGDLRAHANLIGGNTGSGIVISGTSSENIIRNNWIGVDRNHLPLSNDAHGIHLLGGASRNQIGGTARAALGRSLFSLPVGNVIAQNGGDGVRVEGAGSTGNAILHNSIYANAGLGIHNLAGGNDELPPPVDISYGRNAVVGGVVSVDLIPPGSIIQVFSDLGAQGELFLGETTVLAGGNWQISGLPPAALPSITATVTHALTRSTSAFALAESAIGLRITRPGASGPADQPLPTPGTAVLLPLQVEAIGADIRVHQLSFTLAGTDPETLGLSSLTVYRDVDGDGLISNSDFQIAQPAPLDPATNKIILPLDFASLFEGETQSWLLAGTFTASPPEGLPFSGEIAAASEVKAEFVLPAGVPVTPQGAFPIPADNFLTTQAPASGFAAWQATYWSGAELANPAISGPDADPDGDGVLNLLEYALGRDPTLPETQSILQIQNQAGLVLASFVVSGTTDVTLLAEISQDLSTWTPASPQLPVEQTSLADGAYLVTITLNPPGDLPPYRFLRLSASPSQP